MEGRDLSAEGASQPDRVDVFGVGVNTIRLDDATAAIEDWIHQDCRTYVCITSVHGVMESRRDERLRRIINGAGMVTPDGMPLVWFLRGCGSRHVDRVYGPDLMRKMTEISSQRGYRQFYYGGAEGVAHKLQQVLVNAYPGLQVAGVLCPPFRELTPEEDQAVVDAINATRPDIVWVGLSTPKQEFWMAKQCGRVDAPVMIGVGAAFDFLGGTKPQAPVWMQRHGLEWLFRLWTEPLRLWRRYAYIVPGFSILAIAAFAHRAFRSSPDVPSDSSLSR